MKRMKKMISLLLAMMMIMLMNGTVFAAEPMEYTGPFTITITRVDTQDKAAHIYEAYQIFSGNMAAENGNTTNILSNIKWGSGIDSSKETELIEELQKVNAFKDCQTPAAIAEVLAETPDADSDNAKKFADIVENYLSSTCSSVTMAANANTGTIEVGAAGYYLVKDQDNSQNGITGAYTRYMLQVVGAVRVQPKSEVPTVVKEVKEVNDSVEDSDVWQDYADVDFQDEIEYRITATIPDNYSDYETYTQIFTDTMCAGLTYKENSAKVYVVNKGTGEKLQEITGSATITSTLYSGTDTKYKGGTVLTITTQDLKEITEVNKDTQIVVEYVCTLNEKAVTSSTGNPNKVSLAYPNDPNHSSEGTPNNGKTPEDVAIVFTYDLDVKKVNGENAPLAGAGFTLQKWYADGRGWVDAQDEVKGTNMTTFAFDSIDAGIYRLRETTTPAGYNTIDDIYFMVKAEYGNDGSRTSLTICGLSADAEEDDYTDASSYLEALSTGENASFSAVFTSGQIETTIKNQKGSVLPSTGGIGVTIFYVTGSILVIGAGILLITKRRMRGR